MQRSQKLGDALDRHCPEGLEAEEVRVAAHDSLRSCRDSTLQNPVVGWIGFDSLDVFRGLDDACDDTKLSLRSGQPFWCAFELVPEDAQSLRDDGFRDGQLDLAVNGEVEKLLGLASELQGADENVRVSDDPLHDRVRVS